MPQQSNLDVPTLTGVQVLVTGGAGFIGSHLVRALVAGGARVRVLDNLSTGNRANLVSVEADCELVVGDIRDYQTCVQALNGVAIVFHLAAYISVPGSVADPVNADAINIGGTLNLLMAAKACGVRRLVLSSSSAVYGDTAVLPTHEDVIPLPLSPYGVEKLYCEHMFRLYTALHGLETVALRYFNVYGPGQNPKSEYAAVIPKFITMLLAEQTPTIFGDGEQTRDFLFVGDVVRANLLAATTQGAAGHVFNVAGGCATSLNELARTLCNIIGAEREPNHGPERLGDIKHSSADISKARAILGFIPQDDVASGLAKTVAFYRKAV